jgi:putative ABC transport system permease protein
MSLYRRLWNLVRPDPLSRDIYYELSFHIAERVEDLVKSGMERDEAGRTARRQFGNYGARTEQTRDMDVFGSIEAVVKDLHFAVRSLRRKPLFAFSAVITLALGIGASTVIFSVVNAVILRSLPYSNADELIRMYGRLGDRFSQASVSPADFLDYRAESRTFSGIAASLTGLIPMTVTGIPQPLRVDAALVSGNYFEAFAQNAAIGRRLTMGDENTTSPSVVVISSALWQTLYGGREDAIGEPLRLTGPFVEGPVVVVGIMTDEFDAPYDPDIWLPMPVASPDLQSRSAHFFSPVGRLAPGVTPSEAQQELDTIAAVLEQEYPATNQGWSLNLVPFRDTVLGGSRGPLLVLSIAAMLLLLIACSNVRSRSS